KSPSARASLYFVASGDGAGTLFSARITVPAKGEAGRWYVGTLWISDRADNASVPSFTAATVPLEQTLNVVSSVSDSTPPTIRGVSVESGSVRGGERNVIHVDVDDDASGVARVQGTFQSPSRSALIPFACHQDPDVPSSWSGDINVPTSADCGDWT